MAISIDEAVPGPVTGRRTAGASPRRQGAERWSRSRCSRLLAVAMLFPVLWMLETSIKENRDVYAVPAKFFGFDLTLDHYKDVFVARGGRRVGPVRARSSTPSSWPVHRRCWPPCSASRRRGPTRASR